MGGGDDGADFGCGEGGELARESEAEATGGAGDEEG